MPNNVVSQPKIDRLHTVLHAADASAADVPFSTVRARQAKELRYTMTWLEKYIGGTLGEEKIKVTISPALLALAIKWDFTCRRHATPCPDGTIFSDLRFFPRKPKEQTRQEREEARQAGTLKADEQLRSRLFPKSPTAEFRSAFTEES